MKKSICCLFASVCWSGNSLALVAVSPLPQRAYTLDECVSIALRQNPEVLKAKEELQRTRGLKMEACAEAIPHLTISAQYKRIDENAIDVFPGSGSANDNQEQPWGAQAEVTQPIYSGGRIVAAIRGAKHTDRVAVLGFQRTLADTVLNVRKTFYQILLNRAQVNVREQSVKLMEQQLSDTRRRFDAGNVPQFNVLRAEVELANAKPPLIRAQNDLRLSRETLVKLLSIDHQPDTTGFTSIDFTGDLRYGAKVWTLSELLSQATRRRPELQQAEQQIKVSQQAVAIAASGYKPRLELFGSYGIRNTTFGDEIDDTQHGWGIGARANWPIFDGMLTRGKITQARAQLRQAEVEAADVHRRVELEVRQAFSDYLQAVELMEAQKKTVEQGVESLRLAEARFRAGTGTQLDVLSAQTALTEARSNEAQALHDYNVAIATIERVIGVTASIAE